ncbi:MAG: polyprenyl synthetase family protein [Desulforegulaceae bacterium]|nr:polyprenyl synthetase family protein [Desulforegulaceae bacterium]
MENLKEKLMGLISSDIEEIEKAIERNLSPHFELVKSISEHILFSGGKRFRPILMLQSSRICGKNSYDLYDYSVIFEYIHSATLLHDDIIDEAEMRRGKIAAHHIYGAAAAVLTGDFLLARCLNISSLLKDYEIVNEVSKITEEMSQGEIHQLMIKGKLSITKEDYFNIIKRKTAVLIEGACRTGARIAKADPDTIKKLGEYGYNLGMAFQMADDLLDYLSDEKSLGKIPGADLREGKLTLPLIHTLSLCSENEKKFIAEEIEKGLSSKEPDFESVLSLVKQYGGLSFTEEIAQEYVKSAKNALAEFPDSREKEIFFMLADYSVLRKN